VIDQDSPAVLRAEITRLREEVVYLRAELDGSGWELQTRAVANALGIPGRLAPARIVAALMRGPAHSERLVHCCPRSDDVQSRTVCVHVCRANAAIAAAGGPRRAIISHGGFRQITLEGRAWLTARLQTHGALTR
jgi:hypothetical protein